MAPRRRSRRVGIAALAVLGALLLGGCGGDGTVERSVVPTNESVPDLVLEMIARPAPPDVADAAPRLAALAPAGRDDRQLALVISNGAGACRLWTYVTAPASVRYGGMGLSGGDCPRADEPFALGVVAANRMTIVSGVVAVAAHDLAVTYADGGSERFTLTGPVLPELGARVVLFETGNRAVRELELLDADGRAIATNAVAA
jgi:hypothetical protein